MPQPIESPARHPRRFRALRFAFYAFAILVIAGILLFTQYKPAPWEMTLSGSSTELGTAYARALRLPMKLLVRLYLDIINERGLALSFNQLGFSRGPVKEPVFLMLRRLAEHCSSLAEARQQIMTASPGMPFLITASEAATSAGAVFERVRDKVLERPMTGSWIAACNAAQGTNYGTTRLDQILTAKETTVDQLGMQRVLGHPEVLMACNIYSVIFDWHHNRLWLASGDTPAAAGRFREYPLFPQR